MTTPVTPTPCISTEPVARTVDLADVKAVQVDNVVGHIIVVSDLIDTGAAVTCKTVTFRFKGATAAGAIAQLVTGPAIEDALIQLGNDLMVSFFASAVPEDDVDAPGINTRQEIQEAIERALRNGLGGAI